MNLASASRSCSSSRGGGSGATWSSQVATCNLQFATIDERIRCGQFERGSPWSVLRLATFGCGWHTPIAHTTVEMALPLLPILWMLIPRCQPKPRRAESSRAKKSESPKRASVRASSLLCARAFYRPIINMHSLALKFRWPFGESHLLAENSQKTTSERSGEPATTQKLNQTKLFTPTS